MFRGGDEPDTRAMFIVESWPNSAGNPISPTGSFRRSHAFRGMVELNTATADYGSARPVLYTSMDSDKAFDKRHVYRSALDAGMGARALIQHIHRTEDMDLPAMDDANERARALLTGMNDLGREGAASHEKALRTAAEQQQQLAKDLNRGRLDPR